MRTVTAKLLLLMLGSLFSLPACPQLYKQEYTALKGRGVPIILVGSQRMDGYEQGALEAMLRTAGH